MYNKKELDDMIKLQDQRNASSNSIMIHTDITPPSINESLLLRRLIFCTRLLINGNRSGIERQNNHQEIGHCSDLI